MKNPVLTILLAIIFFFSSCALENSVSTYSATNNQIKTEPITSVNKTLMLRLVNSVREKGCRCGDTYYPPVPPVVWDDRLEEAAQNHSNDMFQKNYFSHVEADGSNGGVRLQRAGYDWKAYGENVGMGYKTEREVVEGWLKSPGHCKNIMNKLYKEMGVARAGNYWTQDFGSR